jgi:hypothetical protein
LQLSTAAWAQRSISASVHNFKKYFQNGQLTGLDEQWSSLPSQILEGCALFFSALSSNDNY